MKRFIQTYKVSRAAMIVVKHDSDACVFLVLRWAASDDAPTVLQRFPYASQWMLKLQPDGAVRMSVAQSAAVKHAARQLEIEKEQRRLEQVAASGDHANG